MKKCFKCGLTKARTEFYVHKQMTDGLLGKCKDCTKKDTKERLGMLLKDPDWHEKEKERHREKYYRLGYKEKHKPSKDDKKRTMEKYNNKYPEKYKAKLKSQRAGVKGVHSHHWSYKEENLKDVFYLNYKDHAFIHRHLKYDCDLFCYVTKDGVMLDTRKKHKKFIDDILKQED